MLNEFSETLITPHKDEITRFRNSEHSEKFFLPRCMI